MSTPTDIPNEVDEVEVMESAGADAGARTKSRLNRKALIALVAVVGCVAVSFGLWGVYALISAVMQPALYGISQARETVATAVGLASLPIAALIAAAAFALVAKRSWFRRWNIWIGAVLMTLAIAGGLSFFQFYDGPLAWFTSTYSVFPTLGGRLGDAVIGRGYDNPGVLGVFRAGALAVAAFAVAIPLGGFGRAIGQGFVFLYLGVFMALRAITSKSPPKEELPDFPPIGGGADDSARAWMNGADAAGNVGDGGFSPSTGLGAASGLGSLGQSSSPSWGASNSGALGERLAAYGGGLDRIDRNSGAPDGGGLASPFSTSILGGGLSGGAFASALADRDGDKPAADPIPGAGENADFADSASPIIEPADSGADAAPGFSHLIAPAADEPSADTAVMDADMPASESATFAENGFVSAANGHVNGANGHANGHANGVSPSVYDHAVANDDGDLAAYGLEPALEDFDEEEDGGGDFDEDGNDVEMTGIADGEMMDAAPPFGAEEPPADVQPIMASAAANGAGGLHPQTNEYWSDGFDEDDAEDANLAGVAAMAMSGAAVAVGAASPRAMAHDDDDGYDENDGAGIMWQRPRMDILNEGEDNRVPDEEVERTSEIITRTLGEYGVEVEVGHVRTGPTVTMYGLVPGYVRRNRVVKQVDDDGNPVRDDAGKQISKRVEQKTRVKVDSILAREKDLSLALKTPSLRIETPAMGKSLVGIEVPNPNPSLVTLRSVMQSGEYQNVKKRAHLPIALGRGSGGESVSFDLAKMPHLLVAGATGSGKSVCLNAIVSCMIMEKTPVELRLLLIDPKRVELTPYNGVPHLLAPVVVETDTVVGYLKGLIREMFDRYRRMEEVGVRNIEAYNNKMPDKMPFLCVVVDELADLMMTAAFDVEQSLCRLAQLGRATGIHLIIATQRPSVDVVTGLIKANFPSRISFGVTSQVDSRTILDVAGADKLLGRGDMLYLPIDASKPARVQNVFIGDGEIAELVNFWKSTPWPRLRRIDLLDGADEDGDGAAGGGLSQAGDPGRDDMTDKAIELAMSQRKLSTSLLQRRLRIGYPRAARLMDQLEEEGVVGPGEGSKSRDVIINQS